MNERIECEIKEIHVVAMFRTFFCISCGIVTWQYLKMANAFMRFRFYKREYFQIKEPQKKWKTKRNIIQQM